MIWSQGMLSVVFSPCEQLLQRQKRKGFFHRIVTGDEKWIHYNNQKRRKSCRLPGHASTSSAQPNIHAAKVMLCIWCDQVALIYYELLKPTKPSLWNGFELRIKRPQCEQRHEKVILQHDNARPHVAKAVKTYLETLKWEVLPHPPYSPDIVQSDYYLLRSITHGLAEQQFRSYEDIEKWLDSWIASKDEPFYCNGIRALPETWAKVVANDGQYFVWFICNHFFTI